MTTFDILKIYKVYEANMTKKSKIIYRQGIANLGLEGMRLSLTEHKMVYKYHSGELTRQEFISQALAYARSK